MSLPFSLNPFLSKLEGREEPACAYYYDLDHLSERAQWIVGELPENVRFYYAIKANSDLPVLKALAPHVYGFEVASLGEVHKVRHAVPSAQIAFGGPGKTITELKGALDADVELYHIESELQLVRLNTLAKQQGKSVDVLLRVNPRFNLPEATLQMAGRPTQFGIDQYQIDELLASLSEYSNIRCIGFHFHAISNSLDFKSHLKLIRAYIDLSHEWRDKHDLNLEVINVGGGIGIDYSVADNQFDWQNYCEGLHAVLGEIKPGFQLAMECGRFVSSTCGAYVTEVTDIKKSHDKHFLVLRGGTHQFRLPSSWQHNHPFNVVPVEDWQWPCSRPTLNNEQVTLCGELCTPKDVLAQDVKVEKVRVGDLVVFEKAGAYGWHISHHDFLSHPHAERIYFQNGNLSLNV